MRAEKRQKVTRKPRSKSRPPRCDIYRMLENDAIACIRKDFRIAAIMLQETTPATRCFWRFR